MSLKWHGKGLTFHGIRGVKHGSRHLYFVEEARVQKIDGSWLWGISTDPTKVPEPTTQAESKADAILRAEQELERRRAYLRRD
jgi:hypothetical protein